MYGCESWTIKKAECQRNDAFKLCWRRLLGCKEMPLDYKEMPLDYKETQSVHLKGNHPWKFIGRTDAEAEDPKLLLPDVNSRLIRKDPDAGRDWRQEKKEKTEDEMVGWHHQFNGHVFEQSPGDREGQRSLRCWVHAVTNCRTWLSDWTTTERNGNLNGSPNGFRTREH